MNTEFDIVFIKENIYGDRQGVLPTWPTTECRECPRSRI